MAAAKRTFSTVAHTKPTAEEAIPQAAPTPAPGPTSAGSSASNLQTSGRLDAKTSVEATKPGRSAFTWRQTDDQADKLDDLVRHLRRQLGRRRLDKAAVLAALVAAAEDRDDIRAAVLEHLRTNV